MRVEAIGCTLAAALLVCRALAGDFEDGMTAYKNKDYAGALTLLRRAADQGVASAQFNLGLMYGKGQGVAKDYIEGLKWLTLAAANGSESASKARDSIEKIMAPDQVAEAKRRVSEWLKAYELAK